MSDLNSLVIFAKVVEANSFSEAARRLKMPLATVSRRLADLEDELGVCLIERSTRCLRVTDIGAEVLEQAQRASDVSKTVDDSVSYHHCTVSGRLRIAAPPSIADPIIGPLIVGFHTSYPQVRIQLTVTDRLVDPIEDGVDLVFRLGTYKDSCLIGRKILNYRPQLVASPAYLAVNRPPERPQDLLGHRLLTFSDRDPDNNWSFVHINGEECESLALIPHLSMNGSAPLTAALLAGAGIGELPLGMQQDFFRNGQLIEVMPRWRLRSLDLSVVHAGNRNIPKAVRAFKELAAQLAPTLLPASIA